MRRRLRICLWKQWKRVRTRYRELRPLGLPEWVVHQFANARKGPWRMAHGPMNRGRGQCLLAVPGSHELNRALSKSSSSLVNRRMRTRMSGGVRGRGLAVPSYSMCAPGKYRIIG
ncbi:hypothetical protein [Syntrophothermus sp.]|uniref:hypothetical protein n=1 Tax=Syntrophothermus sp. TaxID=2736299 RepID=UPI00338F2FB0